MKKPERLVHALTTAYNEYLECEQAEATAKFEVLNQKLVEFVKTNLIFWGTLNLDNFACDVLLSKDHSWKLVRFVEAETNEVFVVPVRIINQYSMETYNLPKIFKIGKYLLGDITIEVDKSGHFTYHHGTKANDIYVDLMKASNHDKAWFTDVRNALTDKEYELLKPIDRAKNVYNLLANAKVIELTESCLITRIKSVEGAESVASLLEDNTVGVTSIGKDSNPIMVVGLKNNYVLTNITNAQGAFAYIDGNYYKLSIDLPQRQIVTMSLFKLEDMEDAIEDQTPMFYSRECLLREAK